MLCEPIYLNNLLEVNFDFNVTPSKFIMPCFCEFGFLYIYRVDHERFKAFVVSFCWNFWCTKFQEARKQTLVRENSCETAPQNSVLTSKFISQILGGPHFTSDLLKCRAIMTDWLEICAKTLPFFITLWTKDKAEVEWNCQQNKQ